MTSVLYPGTFDPMTLGHMDVVRRAAALFDRVVVGVAANAAKQPLFSAEERVELASSILADLDNVRVLPFSALLVDFAREQEVGVILRGLRAVSDFEFEFQLAGMNHRLAPRIETLFLPTCEQYAYLSSSLVREIAQLGGAVDQFVHPLVASALRTKVGKT